LTSQDSFIGKLYEDLYNEGAAMPKQVTMAMSQSKETKGTVVFTEQTKDPDRRPHTFYMLKDTYADLGSPESIVMDIKVKA
jgi:hypothetical protein